MAVSQSDYLEWLVDSLSKVDHIRPADFPNIDLYMDQVTTFMSTHLSNSKLHPDDKILTKTMINNYAKDNILPAPVKKKYSKDHMIVLLCIYYLKNILSINDIQNILNPLTERFFNSESSNPANGNSESENSDSNQNKLSMENIYNEIYHTVKDELHYISEDVSQKIKAAKNTFKDYGDNKDIEFLHTFSLICMLSYDVFLKKQVISNLIEKVKSDEEELKKESKKEVKKESKKES